MDFKLLLQHCYSSFSLMLTVNITSPHKILNQPLKIFKKFVPHQLFLLFHQNSHVIQWCFLFGFWSLRHRIALYFLLGSRLKMLFLATSVELVTFFDILIVIPWSLDELFPANGMGIDHILFWFAIGIIWSRSFAVTKIKDKWLLIICKTLV